MKKIVSQSSRNLYETIQDQLFGRERVQIEGLDPSVNLPVTRIHLIGDSNGNGSNTNGTGMVGGYRTPLENALRQWRADFDFVGSHVTVPEGSAPSGLWFTDTVPGASLVTAAAAFAGYVASPGVGVADFILDGIGANDIAGGASLAQMQARRIALDATYDLAAQGRKGTLVTPLVPLVAGTTTGANLAAWTAVLQAYNSWLKIYVQNKADQGYFFFDPVSQLALGEFQTDGAHETRLGQAAAGQRYAILLDKLLGTRQGFTLPRNFKQRKWNASVKFAANGDGLSVAAHPGFNPGSGSFALAFEYYPTSLPAGPLGICEYGQYNVTDFFSIYADGRDCNLYWNNVAGTIFGGGSMTSTSGGTLVLNKWNRIVILADATTNTVGLYVNGLLVGLVQGLPAWNFLQHTMTFGHGPTSNAAQGYYSNIRAFQGSNVPRPGSITGLLAVENDYFLESSIASGNCSASFALDGTLIDNINGNPPMNLVGGAVSAAAQPAGPTPLRPWEYGF